MYKDVSTFFSYFCSFFINTTARNLNWKYKFYSPCHQILKQLALSSRQVEKIKYLNTLRNAIKNSCELKSAFWKCVVFIFHPVGQTEVLDIKNGHKRIILKLQSLCDRQEPRKKNMWEAYGRADSSCRSTWLLLCRKKWACAFKTAAG